MFEKVNRARLDELKKEYQGGYFFPCAFLFLLMRKITECFHLLSPGSEEEIADLREAYVKHKGSIEGILSEIPHSNHEDEARFISILNPLIASGDLKSFPKWVKDTKDTKGKERRKKAGEKEAKQAEEHAKELGVWDEFYGSGKEGKRKTKGKGKANEADEGEAALQALIMRRQEKRGNIFDNLLAKYGGGGEDADDLDEPPTAKKKRRAKDEEDEGEEEIEPPKKKSKAAAKGGRNAASGGSKRTRKVR
jgi:DnaJ homolog subfamily C member 9